VTKKVPMDYHPLHPGVLEDPSSAYGYLHNKAPVHLCTQFEPPFYTLSKYADVSAALRDVARFSSEWGQGPRFTPPQGMLSNPPQHTFFRSLVQQAFTPKAIEKLTVRVEQIAVELLDKVGDKRRWDAHDDYGFPLPVMVITEMLGIPHDDIALFKRWSDASVTSMGAEDPTPYLAELAAMGEYLQNQIADRRKNPGDDLITGLVNARVHDEGFKDEDVLGVVNQLFVGGNETTTSLITNAVWRLLDSPDAWAMLVADESLVEQAVEEALRFDPPVLGLYRTTTEDVTLHGVTIPKDSKVMLHYAAANRDAEVWHDPDVFDITRTPKRHMSLGLGVHFCLGAQLARLEASTALRALVQRFPDLKLKNAGERITPFFLWGRNKLPVEN
jgi:cytochrome P450